jgi:uncharacterized iron-regulated membrane protein
LPPELAESGAGDGASATPPKKKNRFNWRKLLFRLHGWLGLNLGLLLFVICLSGSIATLSYEIDRLLDPAQRVGSPPAKNAAADASYDWTAMHQAVARAFPDGQNLGVYAPGSAYASSTPGAAAVSYVELPTGKRLKVYLDPYTGAVQGHTSFFNAQRFFRSFHRRFFDGDRGITLIAFMGFPMLLLALSGLIYYKGWLKQLIRLRRDKGERTFWADLHKGAGIWCLFFTLLIALTSIFYFVELGFIAAGRYEVLQEEPLPQVADSSLHECGPQPALLPAGRYADSARAALPGLTVHTMRMPHRPGEAVYVDGQRGNPLTRDRANKVHLNPFTGAVLGVQRSSDLGVVPLLGDLADPLHFGYFGGLWTKVLWCALGLLLSFSILAGTYLWVVRSGLSRGTSRDDDEPRGLRPFVWLRGAVVATALTLAYFFVVAGATVEGIQAYASQRPAPEPVAEVRAGPYRAQIACAAPCRPSDGATLTARFRGAGLPLYRRATLGPVGTPQQHDTLAGPARAPSATVEAAPGDSLRLRINGYDGATYAASFAAPAASDPPAPGDGGSWPRTAPGVWGVVGAFALLVVACIGGWLWMLARAFRAEQRARRERARRTRSNEPPPEATLPPTAAT